MNDIATAEILAAGSTGWGGMPELETPIALAGDAAFFGWEIVCLGRRLAGERFARGRVSQDVTVRGDGARQWIERTRLSGGSSLIEAPVGLERKSVFGTFLAAVPRVPENLMATCREVGCDDGDVAVTRVSHILLARYRGQSPEAARKYFVALWARVRPVLAGVDGVLPRHWTTRPPRNMELTPHRMDQLLVFTAGR